MIEGRKRKGVFYFSCFIVFYLEMFQCFNAFEINERVIAYFVNNFIDYRA